MNFTLTWDLFIIVFFALVVTYTFIIGKKESVKIIISSYIAIVAVQGLGNVLMRGMGLLTKYVGTFGYVLDAGTLSWIKLALFIAIIVFLAVRAGFDISYTKEPGAIVNTALTGLLGFATAGLLLSTLLTHIAGVPLLDMSFATTSAATLSPIIQQSQLMQIMILQQDLWFLLPALVLIAAGFFQNQ